MTVLSAQTIERLGIITPCLSDGKDDLGNSVGLSACSYDIQIAEDHTFYHGQMELASGIEYYTMPTNVVGVVHDKSSWVRRGLVVHNTVIDPGWRGFLTLEIMMHPLSHENKRTPVVVPAGSAIAQVIFHFTDEHTTMPYNGKYQDQEEGPQEAK